MIDIPHIPSAGWGVPAEPLGLPAPPAPAEHPLPWRGVCRFCGCVLKTAVDAQRTWSSALGETECLRAPRQDNDDPGHHLPKKALSVDGEVPDWEAAERD